MATPTFVALVLGIIFLTVGVVSAVTAWRAQHGVLPYGSRLGFRMKSTLTNVDTWVVAHGAIVVPFWLATAFCWVNAFLLVFYSTWMTVIQVVGVAVLTVLLLALLWYTTRGFVAARARAFQQERGIK